MKTGTGPVSAVHPGRVSDGFLQIGRHADSLFEEFNAAL